ncbi:tRNA-specific adenosine deaminase 1, partial [Megadyptes antipodes antipodes]
MWSADEIAELCYLHYRTRLPKQGKPDQNREWTSLAAVVKVESATQREVLPSPGNLQVTKEVVAMGTGTKCIGQNKMRKTGDILNDSHAEIVAKRSFQRYLFYQMWLAASHQQCSIFIPGTETGKWKLKPNIIFVFFSSHTPCEYAGVNQFHGSHFKTSLQESQVLQNGGKAWCKENIPLVEEDQVREYLRTLDMHKSLGPDDLCLLMHSGELRELADVIVRLLPLIFDHGGWEKFPKTGGKQMCLHSSRKARREDPGNYRLVGLTLIPGKEMEQLILETISRHMKDKKIVKSSQHGFTKGKSCLTNLKDFFDEVTGLVDEGRAVDVILKGNCTISACLGRPDLKSLAFFRVYFRCQHISFLPDGFLTHEVKLLQSDLQFEHSRQAIQEVQTNSRTKLVPCSAAISWSAVPEQPLDVTSDGFRQGTTKKGIGSHQSRSKICKVELFHTFQKLVTSISQEDLPDTLRMKTLETYWDYKEAALNYQEAWKVLRSQALTGWVKNAKEYLHFT